MANGGAKLVSRRMSHLSVHWCDGLFLRPQHLQTLDRDLNERLRYHSQWDHPFNYGLHAIEFSSAAMEAGRFEVISCEARFRDGTLAIIKDRQQPEHVTFSDGPRDTPESSKTCRAVLAVPKLRMGARNVSPRPGGPERYVAQAQAIADESRGDREQLVELLHLNTRLRLASDSDEGFDSLPLAQVRRTGNNVAKYELDDGYYPPILKIDAWPPLRDLIRAIRDLVRRKMDVLRHEITERGITWDGEQPGDSARFALLDRLNVASTTLAWLVDSPGAHPFSAYRQLAGIVGHLSIFGPERRAPDVPPYDHDDMAPVFQWLKAHIERLIDSISEFAYEKRMFVGTERGMKVRIDPRWLQSDYRCYVGIQHSNATEDECRDFLARLDWKLGSERCVDAYFEARAPGVKLNVAPRVPAVLPVSGRWLYYQIDRQASSENAGAYQDVHATGTLAFRVSDRYIVGCDRLAGSREITLLDAARDKQLDLRVALFAVPDRV